MSGIYEARPDPDFPVVWWVWDVEHPAECNHFPVVKIDSRGASDDLHESIARVCADAMNARWAAAANEQRAEMDTQAITQEDRDAAANYVIAPQNMKAIRAGEMDWNPVVQAFARHRRTAHDRAIEEAAAGPWQRVGTFAPDPDALYLVQGVLRTSIKRGKEIDADNLAAAKLLALKGQ